MVRAATSKPASLDKRSCEIVEARIYELEEQCSFSGDEWDSIWQILLSEPGYASPPVKDGRFVLGPRLRDAVAQVLKTILAAAERRRTVVLPPSQWELIVNVLLPERYREPTGRDAPTAALPGSAEKIKTLAERAARQLLLWHDLDPFDGSDAPDHAVAPADRRKAVRRDRREREAGQGVLFGERVPDGGMPDNTGRMTDDRRTDDGRPTDGRRTGMLRLEDAMDWSRGGRPYNAAEHSESGRAARRCHAAG